MPFPVAMPRAYSVKFILRSKLPKRGYKGMRLLKRQSDGSWKFALVGMK
jgi:hypothetical protein